MSLAEFKTALTDLASISQSPDKPLNQANKLTMEKIEHLCKQLEKEHANVDFATFVKVLLNFGFEDILSSGQESPSDDHLNQVVG